MGLVKREPGNRRWGMQAEFPLMDADGVYVTHDRRCGVDRRKPSLTIKELLVFLTQVTSKNTGRN